MAAAATRPTTTVATMSVRLTVRRALWRAHVARTAAAYGDALAPVVKGNGYGFGRPLLHDTVIGMGNPDPVVCVGTVHELHDVPAGLRPVVLTPSLAAPFSAAPVLTVGSTDHVTALGNWGGDVMVKLVSSMQRYGVLPDGLADLVDAVQRAGLALHAFALHLPLAGDDGARRAEIEAWLPLLPTDVPLWVSHLSPESFHALAADHPDRRFRIRVGTALWHGVPRGDFVHLGAEVVQTRPVHRGEVAGYHRSPVPFDGTLVAIGAGVSAGIAPLQHDDPQRRSPFHFARTRLQLLEPPHMHTSLVVVPNGQPCPAVGDQVDVQRPLLATTPDEIVWL